VAQWVCAAAARHRPARCVRAPGDDVVIIEEAHMQRVAAVTRHLGGIPSAIRPSNSSAEISTEKKVMPVPHSCTLPHHSMPHSLHAWDSRLCVRTQPGIQTCYLFHSARLDSPRCPDQPSVILQMPRLKR
jgi:hypothetical protein